MALIRWEPAREIDSLQTEMNRLFSSFLAPPGADQTARRWTPPMDLLQTDKHYLLKVDLPGVPRDAVSIELDHGQLTISGERRPHTDSPDDGTMLRSERAAGQFARTLTLPDGVDGEAVSAAFVDGVLEVRIPKPEQAVPRKIQITAGDSAPLVEG
ncbi:18 kDa heat shock protein [Paraconexibacter sp. AEG42_29]|uniref:18 kDa heat shock protein n=1 Tax=Paraconexibacter sp. AEG42_29 TaxID=2997339 RepID=A0AAU7AUT3_9ACTN